MTYPAMRSCPLHPPAEYAGLSGPVTSVELTNGDRVWLVTGHAEARALFADPRISGDAADHHHPELARPRGAPRIDPERKRAVQTFVEMDDPEHGVHRRAVIPHFTVRRARELRPVVERTAHELLDRLVETGPPADLVAGFAVRLPAATMARVFGIPDEEHSFFVDQAVRPVLDKDQANDAFRALVGLFDRLLTQRRAQPDDDVLSALANSGLSHQQAINTAIMLLIAGHETTANTIALSTIALLTHPEQRVALQREPAVAVEELLRFVPVADVIPRFAKEDIEIGGVVIRAGDGVVLSVAAANRDAAAFADPDVLDLHRAARHHLTFSFGVHQCLGQNLARVEVEVALGTVFERLPGLALAKPSGELPLKPAIGLQGVTELPVTW